MSPTSNCRLIVKVIRYVLAYERAIDPSLERDKLGEGV